MTKKIVRFYKVGPGGIHVGSAAFIGTVDHPGPNVTNYGDGYVMTSTVKSIKEMRDGEVIEFETHYSIYRKDR